MIIYCQFLYLFNDKLEKFLDFQVIRLAKNYVVGIYMICNLYITCNVKKRGNISLKFFLLCFYLNTHLIKTALIFELNLRNL